MRLVERLINEAFSSMRAEIELLKKNQAEVVSSVKKDLEEMKKINNESNERNDRLNAALELMDKKIETLIKDFQGGDDGFLTSYKNGE